MRKLITLLAFVALAACGPSNMEVKGAKEAHYKGDKAALYAAMKTAVETKYVVHDDDPNTLTLKTEERWYTPEGESAMARDGDMRSVVDKSINIVMVVQLLPDGDNWIVQVHPLYQRYFRGRPNTDRLNEDDPSIPGFAHDKVDTLAATIHDGLKQWEVASMPMQPGAAPGAAPAPAPAPAPEPMPAGGGY